MTTSRSPSVRPESVSRRQTLLPETESGDLPRQPPLLPDQPEEEAPRTPLPRRESWRPSEPEGSRASEKFPAPGGEGEAAMIEEERSAERRLRVRVRNVKGAEGQAEKRLMVYCPEKHRMLALEECEECPQFEGVSLDPTDRDSFLVCRMGEEYEVMDETLWGSTDLPSVPEVTIPEPSDRVTVEQIMTKAVVCVDASMSLETLTAILLDHGISGVPVVDEDRRPIGMISKSDLVRQNYEDGMGREMEEIIIESPETGFEYELGPGFHAQRIAKATVGEIMMPISFTVPRDASLARAAGLMAFEGVHRVPVVDGDGKVVGILSSLDILRWLAMESGYRTSFDVSGV